MKRYMLNPRQSGVVLVIVLWMLALITVMAGSYAAATRTETIAAAAATSNAKARAMAEAGIWKGVSRLLRRTAADTWRADGSVVEYAFRDTDLRFAIQDQNGLIDLNRASAELINGVFTAAGVVSRDAIELSDAVIDWRDTDKRKRPRGAEDPAYQAAGLAYGAKDGPFNTVTELQQVLGVTPEIYARVVPLLTVHSSKGVVNLDTAPLSAMQALPGFDDVTIEQVLDARENGTLDVVLAGLPASARKMIGFGEGKLFEIRAEGRSGNAFARISAIVSPQAVGAQPYTVVVWNNDAEPFEQPASDNFDDAYLDDELIDG